jgi:CBS domain-containing protein
LRRFQTRGRLTIMDTIGSILKNKGQGIHSVAPDATVYDAIAIMAEKGVGAVLVLNGGKLTGIVSIKDYGNEVVLRDRSAKDVRVEEIMTSPVITVQPEVTVTECIGIMTRCHIRHLPVFSGDELVGVISLGDLARAIISDQTFKIDQLMTYVGQK